MEGWKGEILLHKRRKHATWRFHNIIFLDLRWGKFLSCKKLRRKSRQLQAAEERRTWLRRTAQHCCLFFFLVFGPKSFFPSKKSQPFSSFVLCAWWNTRQTRLLLPPRPLWPFWDLGKTAWDLPQRSAESHRWCWAWCTCVGWRSRTGCTWRCRRRASWFGARWARTAPSCAGGRRGSADPVSPSSCLRHTNLGSWWREMSCFVSNPSKFGSWEFSSRPNATQGRVWKVAMEWIMQLLSSNDKRNRKLEEESQHNIRYIQKWPPCLLLMWKPCVLQQSLQIQSISINHSLSK